MNKLLIATLGIYIMYFGSIQFLLYRYRKKKGSNPLNYQLFRIYPKKLIQNEVSRSCKKFYSMSNIVCKEIAFCFGRLKTINHITHVLW